MPENEPVYIGTWCNEEEKVIRAFFGWYFKQSLKTPSKFPQNLTPSEWFDQLQLFYTNVWPTIKDN